MRERWEAYNEEKGVEVNYDYYCDKNEYGSEPEIEDEDYGSGRRFNKRCLW